MVRAVFLKKLLKFFLQWADNFNMLSLLFISQILLFSPEAASDKIVTLRVRMFDACLVKNAVLTSPDLYCGEEEGFLSKCSSQLLKFHGLSPEKRMNLDNLDVKAKEKCEEKYQKEKGARDRKQKDLDRYHKCSNKIDDLYKARESAYGITASEDNSEENKKILSAAAKAESAFEKCKKDKHNEVNERCDEANKDFKETGKGFQQQLRFIWRRQSMYKNNSLLR